ncbi:MAG: hypothetical protein K2Q18_19300, partial [Bdellovibrionales bacterium]|nr:hypothetical protein [Bdellovibrionales bacterium]
MKISLWSLVVTIFLFISNVALAETSALVEKFNVLKESSKELSPDLKIVRAFRSQKKAENHTRLTSHFPNVNLVLRKERDFFEEKNAPLRALG